MLACEKEPFTRTLRRRTRKETEMKYVLDHIGLGRVGRTEIHVDRGVFRDQSADQRERAVLGDGDERVVL